MGIESEPSKNERAKLSVSEVKPIEESRNVTLENRESISQYVEAPLVSACQIFWDKNIQTLSSSCNEKDVAIGCGHIIINFNSLSLENQAIARSIAEPVDYDGQQALVIKFPVGTETRADEIEQMTEEIANKFVQQDASWVPRYSVDYVKATLGISSEESIDPEEISRENGLYWDEGGQLFYPSKELFLKAGGGSNR